MKTDTPSPVVLWYPTRGSIRRWALSDGQLYVWQKVYPHLDVLKECRKAWAWVDASPQRRKTAPRMRQFLVGWFNRETLEPQIPVRRPAAQVPSTRAVWRTACHAAGHRPGCSTPERHALRCFVQEAGCPHPGVCQTVGECRSRKGAST